MCPGYRLSKGADPLSGSIAGEQPDHMQPKGPQAGVESYISGHVRGSLLVFPEEIIHSRDADNLMHVYLVKQNLRSNKETEDGCPPNEFSGTVLWIFKEMFTNIYELDDIFMG